MIMMITACKTHPRAQCATELLWTWDKCRTKHHHGQRAERWGLASVSAGCTPHSQMPGSLPSSHLPDCGLRQTISADAEWFSYLRNSAKKHLAMFLQYWKLIKIFSYAAKKYLKSHVTFKIDTVWILEVIFANPV